MQSNQTVGVRREELMKRFLFGCLVISSVFFFLEAEAATLAVQDAKGSAGQTVAVSVAIDDVKDLLAADLTLKFDSNLLVPATAEKTSLTSNFIIAFQVRSGEIAVAMAAAQALQNGSEQFWRSPFKSPILRHRAPVLPYRFQEPLSTMAATRLWVSP